MEANLVHVWPLQLAEPEEDGALRSRDDRLALTRARRRASWAAVRRIVAGHTGIAPGEVAALPQPCRICGGPHGKPRLVPPLDGLGFNLARSGAMAVIAVGVDRDVGIDLEPRRRRVPALGSRCWTDSERRTLGRRPARERRWAMLLLLTRKEAYLKACGLGLPAMSRVALTVPPNAPAVREDRAASARAMSWTLVDLQLPGAVGALAGAGSD